MEPARDGAEDVSESAFVLHGVESLVFRVELLEYSDEDDHVANFVGPVIGVGYDMNDIGEF